jgi:Lanthionine synthetase C-like protein
MNSDSTILTYNTYPGLAERQSILQKINDNYSFEELKTAFDKQESVPGLVASDMSFLTGKSGLIYLYIKAFEKNRNPYFLSKAEEIFQPGNCIPFINNTFNGSSLYKGKAGLLFAGLYLYSHTEKEDTAKIIEKIILQIIEEAVLGGNNIFWYNPLQLVIRPLCSFGSGASGIAYVFKLIDNLSSEKPFSQLTQYIDNYIESCLNKDQIERCDFRKEIYSYADYSTHLESYKIRNLEFFKKGEVCLDIENGLAGINFYLQFSQTPEHIKDLFRTKSQLVKQKSENILNSSDSILTPSFDKKLKFPFFLLARFKEMYKIILKNNFPISVQSISKTVFNATSDNIPPESFLFSQINLIKDEKRREFVMSIFEHEKLLLEKKYRLRQNPLEHISASIQLREIIAPLNITNKDLLNKTLIVNKDMELKTFYRFHSEKSTTPEKGLCYWLYNTETGISEYSIEQIGFIIFMFKKAKTIKYALFQVILFMLFSNVKKIQPLIDYSNSKNKKDIITRMPFLFLYQIRLLIKDNILVFDEKPKRLTSIRDHFISLLFSITGVYKKL